MLKEYYEKYWQKRVKEDILPPIRSFIPEFLRKYTAYGAILNRIPNDSCILDIGCGDGNVSQLYLEKAKVYGLDISEKAVEEAIKKGIKAIAFDLNSQSPLPYKDNSFDIVITTDVLEHIINVKKLLDESKRILKKEGQIIITVPNFARLNNRLRMVIGDPIDMLHWSKYGDEIEHLHWLTNPKLFYLLKTSGFREIKAVPTGLPFGFLFGIIGLPSLVKMLTICGKK